MPLSKSSVSLKTDTSSKLKGSTQYTLTVSAEGYVRNVQKVTLSEDTNMDVVLEKGATVNFNVYQASGKKTDNAAIKVTYVDGTKEYSPVLDEYGDEILPDENGYYTVIFGQYRYTIEADGYDTKSATFNATDTSLKNNNYVITVKLTSPYDTLLNKADDYLFNQSGDGLMMTEYSGVHSDLDLINVANTDDYGYYFICSSWQSSNPDVIDPETGKVTRPEKDTLVKLYVKTYYSQSQLDDGGFLFDGGPLGDNEAYQSLYVMVKGTKTQVPTTQPTTTEPDTSATEPSTSAATQPSNLASASTVNSSVSSTSTTAKSTASKPKKLQSKS